MEKNKLGVFWRFAEMICKANFYINSKDKYYGKFLSISMPYKIKKYIYMFQKLW